MSFIIAIESPFCTGAFNDASLIVLSAFFSAIGYCSDSRGAWHHGHPLAHQAVAQSRALQLLTHPIWWPSTVSPGPLPTLDRFVSERDTLLRTELAANCEPYRTNNNELENGC